MFANWGRAKYNPGRARDSRDNQGESWDIRMDRDGAGIARNRVRIARDMAVIARNRARIARDNLYD